MPEISAFGPPLVAKREGENRSAKRAKIDNQNIFTGFCHLRLCVWKMRERKVVLVKSFACVWWGSAKRIVIEAQDPGSQRKKNMSRVFRILFFCPPRSTLNFHLKPVCFLVFKCRPSTQGNQALSLSEHHGFRRIKYLYVCNDTK